MEIKIKKNILLIIVMLFCVVSISGVNAAPIYDDVGQFEQGLHWWVFVSMLLLIGGCMVGLFATEESMFSVLAGVLMIILAVLIYNGIFYSVCDVVATSQTVNDTLNLTNYTYDKQCYTQELEVPKLFYLSMETLLVVFGCFIFIYGALQQIRKINRLREDDGF